MKRPVAVPVFLRCLLAGACIALAMPSPGWWPLAFVGLAMWDRLIANVSWKKRFKRTWLIGVMWFFPTMLWMLDLTPPGYVIACVSYAAYFGVACAFVPPGRGRWIAFPGAVVLATACMWTFPFGGVPLANLALTQAHTCAPPCVALDSPVAQASRLLGPLLVVALVVIGGIALSAAWERRTKAALIALGIVVGVSAIGFVAPKGQEVGSTRVAIVQGGGPQRTRYGNEDSDIVFQRHLDATRQLVQSPVDVIIWPENVVAVEGRLQQDRYLYPELQKLAREKQATLLVGITEGISDENFLNAEVVIEPDGTIGDRYDKVRTVPFGEFVPLRGLLEAILGEGELPRRDALPGTDLPGDDHGVLHTEAGDIGTVISWETFFDGRARDAIANGGQILSNPTNGASYWGTQVQTQQIASSRLRAIETGRWMAQAAPTGYSAVIDPNGNLVARSGTIGSTVDRWVWQGEIPKREGNTPALLAGHVPMLVLSIASIAIGWWVQRRTEDDDAAVSDRSVTAGAPPDDPDASTRAVGSEVDGAREVERVEEAPVV